MNDSLLEELVRLVLSVCELEFVPLMLLPCMALTYSTYEWLFTQHRSSSSKEKFLGIWSKTNASQNLLVNMTEDTFRQPVHMYISPKHQLGSEVYRGIQRL